MQLIGQKINHKSFGIGTVTALTTEIVTVCFQGSEKKFIYPDAFRHFLFANNKTIQKQIERLIADKDAEILRKKQLEQAEHDRKNRLLNYRVTANSHAAFNVACGQAEHIRQAGSVLTGTYLSGYSRGKPRIPDRIKPNSMCLITTRLNGQPEQNRIIVGACMVKEDYFGEDCQDGVVEFHPQYRLFLPVGKSMFFWEHISQDIPRRWGNTAFKYCSGDIMSLILFKILELFDATDQRDISIEFYRYFCQLNRIRSLVPIEKEQSPEQN